jgi:hypothetical protein
VLLLGLASAITLGGAVAWSPLAGIGLLVAAAVALAIAVRPGVATLVVVFLIYSNAAVVAVVFHGLPAITAAAVPLLLGVPLSYNLLVRREPIVVTPGLPWVVALLIVQILGTLFARDTDSALAELSSFLVEGIGLYLLVTNVVRTPADLRQVIWVLLAVGILLGGISAWKEVTHTYASDYWGFAQSDATSATLDPTVSSSGLDRQAGPIGEKNRFAQVMLMLVPLGLFQARAERRRALKLVALAATGLAAIAVALTFSRGAIVGFGLLVVVMIAMRYVRIGQLAIIALGTAALLVAVPALGDRLASLEAIGGVLSDGSGLSAADTSVQSRAAENLTAIAVFSDHPIIGVGPGQFSNYYREYAVDVGGVIKAQDREAHNLYLAMAADTGVLGLTCFLAILAVTLFDLVRARRRWLHLRPDLADMATGLLLAVLSYMATGLFLHLSYARYFWLVMAIAGAAAVILRRLPAPADQGAYSQSVNPKFLPVRAGAGPRSEVP